MTKTLAIEHSHQEVVEKAHPPNYLLLAFHPTEEQQHQQGPG